MSYPQGQPGNPGYPPAQQPTTQFAAPTQQFGKAPEAGPAAAEGPSKLPEYLTAAVAALGLALYLSSFGPLFTAGGEYFTPTLLDLGVVAGVARGVDRRRRPAAQAEGQPRARRGAVRAGFPACHPDRAHRPRRRCPRLGAVPHHRVQRAAGHRGGGGAVVRRRRAQRARCRSRATSSSTASTARPASTTGSRSSTDRRSSRPPSSSARDIRRNTAATRVAADPPPADSPADPSPGLRRRRPDSRPTASRRRVQPRHRRCRRSRNPRSRAPRRRNLSRACVNFARVSVRGERRN